MRLKLNAFTFDAYHVKGLSNVVADGLSRFSMELVEKDKNQILRPVLATDLHVPKMTLKQQKDLQEYITQAKNLRSKQKQLVEASKSKCMVSQLMYHPVSISDRYTRYKDANDTNWNEMLKLYRYKSPYLEKQQIRDLINCSQTNLIVTSEYAFNDAPFINLINNAMSLCTTIKQLSKPTQHLINLTFNRQQQTSIKSHLILACHEMDIPIHIVNASSKKRSKRVNRRARKEGSVEVYNPTEDLQNIPKSERPANLSKSPMRLRSHSKQVKAKAQPRVSQDFINVDFNQNRPSFKTREEFMQDIFGHRRDLDIHNLQRFIQYQNDDNLIGLVKNLLPLTIEDRRVHPDLSFVWNWDPWLASKLMLSKARLNQSGVLQVHEYCQSLGEDKWVNVVPFNIRGKFMDFAHHNLQNHHFDSTQTLNQLEGKYWWGTMKKDVEKYCDTCYLCQFTKGSIRHRAPLRIRQLPKPREHIFCDFLGSVFSKYYVLVIVDYATGYTMLIPTNGTDAITVIESVIQNWVRVFGWFKTLETDWGSGFNNLLLKVFMKSASKRIEIAEPRNHRSIGKVERIIGFLQSVFNRYNALLNQRWTDEIDKTEDHWRAIEILLPFIQLSFNQRRPRFTTYSPNMLMFGTNLNNIDDIDSLQSSLQDIQRNHKNLPREDYQYLSDLMTKMRDINQLFKSDWKKYTWLSTEEYKKRWNINDKSVNRYLTKFKVGSQVLYYIGDKRTSQHKWRRKWTGPWRIDMVLNDSTLIIADPETGNQKRVSFDRIKKFKTQDLYRYADYVKNDQNYLEYMQHLKDILSNYNASTYDELQHLDYRDFDHL